MSSVVLPRVVTIVYMVTIVNIVAIVTMFTIVAMVATFVSGITSPVVGMLFVRATGCTRGGLPSSLPPPGAQLHEGQQDGQAEEAGQSRTRAQEAHYTRTKNFLIFQYTSRNIALLVHKLLMKQRGVRRLLILDILQQTNKTPNASPPPPKK